MSILKNKRANIQIIILVIGVLLICGLVLFSFHLSKRNVKSTLFGAQDFIEKINIEIEKHSLYGNLGMGSNFVEVKSDKGRRYIGFEDDSIGMEVKYFLPRLKTFIN